VSRSLILALAAFLALSGTAAASAGPTFAASVVITVDSGVSPQSLEVGPGTTVRWVNRDGERHRFRSKDGPQEFDSGNLEPGESYAVTLRAVGVYRYLDERDEDNTRYHGAITVRSGTSPTPAPPAGSTPRAPIGNPGTGDAPAASSATVTMGDRVFSPATVTIAAGGRVEFTNNDDRPHTATGDGWDTGILDQGGTAGETFRAAGTFAHLCAIHPEMTGTVVVKGASSAGTTPPKPAATPAPAATPKAVATPTPTASIEAPPPASGATSIVRLVDFEASPASLSISPGAEVEFRNEGKAMHTATAEDGSFDTGFLATGASSRHTFGRPGTYDFLCTLHPDMKGSITVVAGGGPTTSAPAGSGAGAGAPSPSPVSASPPSDHASRPATAAPSMAAAGGGTGPAVTDAPAGQNASEAERATAPTATLQRASANVGGLGLAVALAVAAVFAFGLLVRGVAGADTR
jgi:plastocyanin